MSSYSSSAAIHPSKSFYLVLIPIYSFNKKEQQDATIEASHASYMRFKSVLESRTKGMALVKLNDKGKYACNGIQCHHSAFSGWQSIDWPARVNEAEFDELDFSCVVLSALGMCIYKPLSLILCAKCKLLLDLKGLRTHAECTHKGALPSTRRGEINKYELLIAHLEDEFGIPKTFLPPPRLVAHRPIPLLKTPQPYLLCPNPKCSTGWGNSAAPKRAKRNLRNHLEASNTCNSTEAATPLLAGATSYLQVAYPGKIGGNKRIAIQCPNGWTPHRRPFEDNAAHPVADPDQEVETPVKLLDIVDQSYAENLGWSNLFKTSKGDMIEKWRMLLIPFDNDEGGYDTKEQHKKTQVLERGISNVHQFLYEYLESANTSVNSFSEIFRAQITPSNG